MNLTIAQLSALIGIICSIIGAGIGYIGNDRLKKQDATGAGKEKGEIATDIKYIKDGIDELKTKQNEQDKKYVEIIVKVAQLESSYKSLHKRLDSYESSHPIHYPDIE